MNSPSGSPVRGIPSILSARQLLVDVEEIGEGEHSRQTA
jgi:hypothetical protein